MAGAFTSLTESWRRLLRRLVLLLGILAGVGVLGMMLITCADIIARAFGRPIKGSYDAVCLLSLITLSCALPYTTALKGHVAVEYFFNKLPPLGRLAVDSIMRILVIGLLGLVSFQAVKYGISLRASGEVMATTQWPIYWASYVMALSCAVSGLVVIQQLLHPRREVLSP